MLKHKPLTQLQRNLYNLPRDDEPTLIAALFGDPAAQELGLHPLGLIQNAGLELGLHLEIR